MRWLRIAASAAALASWLAIAFAQQGAPPAGTPPARSPAGTAPPAGTPPADKPPPAGAPDQADTPKPPEKEDNDVFVPTEELQPDAAVTFPVDI